MGARTNISAEGGGEEGGSRRRGRVSWGWQEKNTSAWWKWNEVETRKGMEKENCAANSKRNFLWCQSWQMERKRNLKETLVFDVKRGEEWCGGRTSRRKKYPGKWKRVKEKKAGARAGGESVSRSGRNHYQCWLFVPYTLGQLNRSQAFKVKWKCGWPATCSARTHHSSSTQTVCLSGLFIAFITTLTLQRLFFGPRLCTVIIRGKKENNNASVFFKKLGCIYFIWATAVHIPKY